MINEVFGSLEKSNVRVVCYADDVLLPIGETFLQTIRDLIKLAIAKNSLCAGGNGLG